MAELNNKLAAYLQVNPSVTIGQIFNYFASLGYTTQEIDAALHEFSNTYIEKTTDECN